MTDESDNTPRDINLTMTVGEVCGTSLRMTDEMAAWTDADGTFTIAIGNPEAEENEEWITAENPVDITK